jgi:ring-1,2-phenylacetyl-CoA epoxidase subunit PaaD
MNAHTGSIDLSEIWARLEEVMDPEIPVVSVVDLGIVRELAWSDRAGAAELVVTVTPTYSGCPAIDAIEKEIIASLRRHGIERVRLETRLSPAWSTDWLSLRGREKLREFGITPPQRQAGMERIVDVSRLRATLEPVPCPRCSSFNTGLTSRFGSTACKALYKCADCLEPFDYFKPH